MSRLYHSLFAPWIGETPFGVQAPESKQVYTPPSGKKVGSVRCKHVLTQLLMKQEEECICVP